MTYYEELTKLPDTNMRIVTVLGADTEFEAVAVCTLSDDHELWDGVITFKDTRFSPYEIEGAPLQLGYRTFDTMSGMLVLSWSQNLWETLVKLFKRLLEQNHD